MPHDERALEVSAWLEKAAEDLRAAEIDLSASPPLLADAGFHCQQAVEKAMKGLFVFDAEPFGKTHDLRFLGDLLAARHPQLEDLVDRVSALTEYAWRFSYPGDLFEPPEDEVRESLSAAEEFVETVRELVSGG